MPLLILLIGVGAYFTLGTGFWQLRNLGRMFAMTFGRMFGKKTGGGITPFQAMATALASTVGVGNIAGVASAITAGGPGAIFWMWVSSLLGMMTKYAEVLLSVRYRHRERDGMLVGGPMYVIERGMGKRWRWLAVLFCVFGTLASLGVGNITQVNTMADALRGDFSVPPVATGIVVVALAGFVMLGGIKSIAKVAEFLVPFMAGMYTLLCVMVLVICRENIIPALQSIVSEAFHPSAAIGGAAGFGVAQAIRMGVSRGVFSNEAGLGSSPIAHASAECDSPVEQGMWGAVEVFIDTIVMCTLTALAILCSGAYRPGSAVTLDGAPLTSEAFARALGPWGGAAVSVCTTLFALATILGWSFYGERCCAYLFRGKWVTKAYRCVYIFLLLPGAVLRVDLVWRLSDFLNSLMTAPNLVSLIALSGVVFRATRDYDRGRLAPRGARGLKIWQI